MSQRLYVVARDTITGGLMVMGLRRWRSWRRVAVSGPMKSIPAHRLWNELRRAAKAGQAATS